MCSIDLCDRPVSSRGWCNLHYQRWRSTGDPTKTRQMSHSLTADERLRYHGWTVTDTGCWEWNGARFKRGLPYAMVTMHRRPYIGSRLAYETWVGPIPEGHVVRHKCDNPPCINPDHLETGTKADNSRDMIVRGRSRRKLSTAQVAEIRQLASEFSRAELGRRFGVAACTVSQIVNNKARNGD